MHLCSGVTRYSGRFTEGVCLRRFHGFPPEVIRQAVWLYFKFTLSLRDVKDILAKRGIDVSYETVRCWAEKFGSSIAAKVLPVQWQLVPDKGLNCD